MSSNHLNCLPLGGERIRLTLRRKSGSLIFDETIQQIGERQQPLGENLPVVLGLRRRW
jgi:hypothetical protein